MQNNGLEAHVNEVLGIRELVSGFLDKWGTLRVHRKPEHFTQASRSISHREVDVD
jgi:hypothetical protein